MKHIKIIYNFAFKTKIFEIAEFVNSYDEMNWQLRCSQKAPENCDGHRQKKDMNWSTHTPPFLHGLDAHSLTPAAARDANIEL